MWDVTMTVLVGLMYAAVLVIAAISVAEAVSLLCQSSLLATGLLWPFLRRVRRGLACVRGRLKGAVPSVGPTARTSTRLF